MSNWLEKMMGSGSQEASEQTEATPEVVNETVETPEVVAPENESVTPTVEETPTEEVEKVEAPKAAPISETVVEEAPRVEEESTTSTKAVDVFNKLNKEVQEKYGLSLVEANDLKAFDVNADSHSEMDILLKGMKLNDPGMENKESEYLKDKYSVLFKYTNEELSDKFESGDLDERHYRALDFEFSKELRQAKNSIITKQNEIDLDVIEFKQELSKEEPTNVAPSPEQVAEVTKIVNEGLKSYETEKISIKDKDGKELLNLDYAISDEDRAGIETSLLDPRGFNKFFEADTDQEAVKKMGRATLILENFDKIAKFIYDQAKNAGSESTIKDVNNIDFSESVKTGGTQTDEHAGMRSVFSRRN